MASPMICAASQYWLWTYWGLYRLDWQALFLHRSFPLLFSTPAPALFPPPFPQGSLFLDPSFPAFTLLVDANRFLIQYSPPSLKTLPQKSLCLSPAYRKVFPHLESLSSPIISEPHTLLLKIYFWFFISQVFPPPPHFFETPGFVKNSLVLFLQDLLPASTPCGGFFPHFLKIISLTYPIPYQKVS